MTLGDCRDKVVLQGGGLAHFFVGQPEIFRVVESEPADKEVHVVLAALGAGVVDDAVDNEFAAVECGNLEWLELVLVGLDVWSKTVGVECQDFAGRKVLTVVGVVGNGLDNEWSAEFTVELRRRAIGICNGDEGADWIDCRRLVDGCLDAGVG